MIYYNGFHVDHTERAKGFPFSLPIFQNCSAVTFTKPITIFVGENGSGKSTLLESLAIAMNLPAIGSADLETDRTLADLQVFADHLIGSWSSKTYRGFFFRAEDYFGFVKRLHSIDKELDGYIVDFEKELSGSGLKRAIGSILGQKEALEKKYSDLNKVSHGEGFLKVLQQRIQPDGIYLIDEPEAALSPQRQLGLYSLIKQMSEEQNCQFIIATHSPILMTLANSQLFEFENDEITETQYQDTEHFTVMKQFLNNPEAFTRYL